MQVQGSEPHCQRATEPQWSTASQPLGHVSPWGKVGTFGRAADCPQLGRPSCGGGSLLHGDSRVCRVCRVGQRLPACSCVGKRLCAHTRLTRRHLRWASALLAPCRPWLHRGPCRPWLNRGPCRPWLHCGPCATRRSRDPLSPLQVAAQRSPAPAFQVNLRLRLLAQSPAQPLITYFSHASSSVKQSTALAQCRLPCLVGAPPLLAQATQMPCCCTIIRCRILQAT